MSRLRGTIVLTCFVLLTLPLMPIQFLLNHTSKNLARLLPFYYHKLVCKILGVRLRIIGAPPQQPSLFISNHVSWLDIPILSATHPVSFIAKKEVATWPFFGQLSKLQRSVFVDRERRSKTATSRNEISERVKAGDTVVLFPEGTSHDGRNVLPFKSSLLGAVDRADIPVVPLAICYRNVSGMPLTSRQRPRYAWYGDMDLVPHLWAMVQAGNITVDVVFLDAMYLGQDGRKALAQKCEVLIRTTLAKQLHASDKIG